MRRRGRRTLKFFRQFNRLVRSVLQHDGRPYAHSCEVAVFRRVLHAIEEATEPTTLMEIAETHELPYTQVNVAMEFLKDRGLLEVLRRRSVSASTTLFEDGMTEFYALLFEPLSQQ